MDLGLEGKVALVTGGTRDIGREIAVTHAGEGAGVAINYCSSRPEADPAASEIRPRSGRTSAYGADITDYGSFTRMATTIEDFGRIDILEWRSQIGVGLYGVIHCGHAVATHNGGYSTVG